MSNKYDVQFNVMIIRQRWVNFHLCNIDCCTVPDPIRGFWGSTSHSSGPPVRQKISAFQLILFLLYHGSGKKITFITSMTESPVILCTITSSVSIKHPGRNFQESGSACFVSTAAFVSGGVVCAVLNRSPVPQRRNDRPLSALSVCQCGLYNPHQHHYPHLPLQQQRGGLSFTDNSLTHLFQVTLYSVSFYFIVSILVNPAIPGYTYVRSKTHGCWCFR